MCVCAASEKGNSKIERMSVSDPGGKIVQGVDSESRKNEGVPSSENINTKMGDVFVKFCE
jgi:hypothetical protein